MVNILHDEPEITWCGLDCGGRNIELLTVMQAVASITKLAVEGAHGLTTRPACPACQRRAMYEVGPSYGASRPPLCAEFPSSRAIVV